MLVLVATRDTQGDEVGDYFHAVEGELVTPVTVECCVPDRCGCGRGFPGLVSGRAATTAMVAHRPAITPAVLRDAVAESLRRGGWFADGDELADELIHEHVDAITRVGTAFGEGAVVRRDGATFWAEVRRPAA